MYKIYQVEYGDTLDTIASKTNTTVDNIKMINGFSDNYMASVGDLIIVPNIKDELFMNYIVQVGDTIYSVGRMFNLDVDTLLKLNGLGEFDYIYPNQEIIVPNPDTMIYITKPGDTINDVLNNLKVDINTLVKENGTIFVTEDQLMVHKKEANN